MPQFATPHSRLSAIQRRDPLAVNAFIYSVTTTKIYCRPTCPSRLARRANIVFHDTAAEAEADGFRACLRCRPGMSWDDNDPQKIAVSKACELIRKELEGGQKWGVKALASEVGLTESHFCRIFKKVNGMTVGEYRAKIWNERGIPIERAEPSKLVEPTQTPGGAAYSFEFPYAVDGFHIGDPFLDMNPELADEWINFSGAVEAMNSFDSFTGIPGADPIGFNFSPELLSDASTPTTNNDEFQFFDFGASPLPGCSVRMGSHVS